MPGKKPDSRWASVILLGLFFGGGAVRAEDDPLQGGWQTGCVPMGANGRHGAVITVVFTGDTVRSAVMLHDRDDCATPTLTAAYIGQRRRWVRDGRGIALDHSVTAITMTLHRDEVTTHYNRQQNGDGCGITGWVTGVPVDVTGRPCRPVRFPEMGAVLYDRLEVAGDALALGSLPLLWSTPLRNSGPRRWAR